MTSVYLKTLGQYEAKRLVLGKCGSLQETKGQIHGQEFCTVGAEADGRQQWRVRTHRGVAGRVPDLVLTDERQCSTAVQVNNKGNAVGVSLFQRAQRILVTMNARGLIKYLEEAK